MNKQPEVTEKTRQTFINVFCELYSAKPIEKITIQEIANRSGYNRSTFYQYFTDVYDLLHFIENDIFKAIREKLSRAEHNSPQPQELLQFFEENETALQALLGDYGNMRFAERLKSEFFAEGPQPCLPDDHSLSPYLIEFQLSTSFSLLRLWQRRHKDLPPEELLQLIDMLCNSGISSVAQEPYTTNKAANLP
ncbi:TetR/AcrR family transcriptional regulator [Paenibacillus tritici]|uniref:TetR/AcrR family transcriptional regulator n=1 Tax=Paenibacillus tritici TaxID=1873425 RepID=A0ABX2DT47_9BACL|nr:TetR/AcrR family transcriptional regulator [Paenibacillus tritici]NQX47861.1 TetR/AcrR family transcriptional regulator [Paenibacillus tritici]